MKKAIVITILCVSIFSVTACSQNSRNIPTDEKQTITSEKNVTDNNSKSTTESEEKNVIQDVDLWNKFEMSYENADDEKSKKLIEQEIIDFLADNLTGTYELRNDWATTFFWK